MSELLSAEIVGNEIVIRIRLEMPSAQSPLPPKAFYTTRQAAQYCGFETPSAIRAAVLRGKLRPTGRRGGRGPLTFEVAELDRFMRGSQEEAVESQPPSPTLRTRTGKRKMSPETEAALKRLRG